MVADVGTTSTAFDDYATGLLSVYQIERQDQQVSGNQSLALVSAGLAYAAAAATLLSRAALTAGQVDPLLIMAAPLPLVALVSLLVLWIANVKQRARYLVAIERELEPHFFRTLQNHCGDSLAVPDGFRRSQRVFSPIAPAAARRVGRLANLLRFAAAALGVLAYGAIFLVEAGLIGYVVHLLSGWRVPAAGCFYGCCLLAQGLGWSFALKPPAPRRHAG